LFFSQEFAMSHLAILLVLTAAFLHASWNFLAKKAGGGATFVWLFGSLASLIYAPLALGLVLVGQPTLTWMSGLFVLGSALLHLAYFLALSQGYRVGDLSIVYPLARGTGPMIATLAAIAFLGERPTPVTLAGAVLIGLGIYLLAGNPAQLKRRGALPGITYALLTGLVIAGYTLWDKQAVSAFLVPPLLLDWGTNFGRTLMLTPHALRHWEQVRSDWSLHKREALGIALLCPLAYILVLTALAFSPVSSIAPAREISTLIGAAMGVKLLAEGDAARRLSAAGMMVVGVLALFFG
jgi:drug/metabolite transporter (DMT)-like permease